MMSASLNSIVSSFEEMLVNIQTTDENEQPKDLPPELPSRPKNTRKARLPSLKLPLPIVEDTNFVKKKVVVRKRRRTSFGGKKVKDSDSSESPYVRSPEKIEFGITTQDLNGCFSPGRRETKFMESEIDDNIGYFIRKKLRVWCCIRSGKYESGHIQSTSIDKANVKLSDGSVVTVPTVNLSPANPDILEGVEDLIQLSYLNEPSVLNNLQRRYFSDMIYSKAGPVLVAINPFKKVEIYGNEQIMAYRQKLVDSPHVYAIADAAFSEVMSDEVNQSIIISGESGSGKTETAKIAMQYLATLSGGSNGIQSEIFQTNYILEAFGNAKTCRNDNSSRFGKLIEIHFSATGKLSGAKIQTCLLEKSRVVQVATGERSYHIFYQLCAGAPADLREKLKLRTANDYHYLNQSKCLTINNVDDSDRFHKLRAALEMLRISKEDQEQAFEMLAAVLWLGNISFCVIDNENHIEVLDDEATKFTTSLLGCSAKDLMSTLSTHKIQAGKDKVSKRLTLEKAINARDALAKLIYASLFDWLVEEINKSLAVGKDQTGRSISILDIYGFESLKKNSFEQLCINYANERLQQHFNRHLFKLEQEEYELDGIDWTRVDFVDNQICLDLFEKKPIGLISLLDEESKFPRATDLTFANKVKQHLDSNPCFKLVRGGSFGILHSAGEVVYDTSGFLDKNRDSLHSDTIELLSLCQGRLPRAFSSELLNQSLKQSVATKFKGQLFNLMHRLASTTPHFIRCIKPNSKQIPGLYDNETVLEQLRCCGVLEVVRIARSGYPTTLTHQEFTRRYGFLLSEDCASQDPLSISVSILRQFNILPEMYQVGYTKLYFRAGQIGSLERMRRQFLQGIVQVQKCFRGQRVRRYFNELRGGAIALQSIIRGRSDRRKYSTFQEQDALDKQKQQLRAVVVIQSGIRGWLAQNHLGRLQNSRKKVQKLKEQDAHNNLKQQLSAAVQIQSGIRGWLAQIHLGRLQSSRKEVQNLKEQQLCAVVQIQSGIRGRLARKRLCRLQSSRKLEHYMHRVERKMEDIEDLPKEMLISIIEDLHRRVYSAEDTLSQKDKENTALREEVQQLEARRSKYKAKTKLMETEDSLGQKEKENTALRDQVRQLERSMYKAKIKSMEAKGTLRKKEKENKALRAQVRQLEKQRSEYKHKIKSMELTWKREKESLQLSLVEAQMSFKVEDSSGQLRKADCSSPSPGGSSKKDVNKELDSVADRETNGDPRDIINQLRSEFEKNKETLNEKAKTVLDVNSGQPKPANPVQEYQQLKLQFESFSKDFKVQLRQLRAKIYKLRHTEGDRSCQKCWGK